jgi:hypothetical protein
VEDWTEDFVRLKNEPLEAVLRKLSIPVSELTVRLFGSIITRNHGTASGDRTHFLRTAYANYAFFLHGERIAHVAFIQKVLGHKSAMSSHNNNSWIKIVRPQGTLDAEVSFRMATQEAAIQRRVDNMKRHDEEMKHRDPQPLLLPTLSGSKLLLPPRALTRKRRVPGESQETHVAARERLLREMVQYVTEVLVPAGVDVAALTKSDFLRLRFNMETVCDYLRR